MRLGRSVFPLALVMVSSLPPLAAGPLAAGPVLPWNLQADLVITGDREGMSRRPKPVAWPLVQVPDPTASRVLQEGLNRAWDLLGEDGCRSVLAQFSDAAGLSLDRRLASLNVDAQSYLMWIVFIDDRHDRMCVGGVVAFTQPASRVVRVCVEHLKQTWRRDPAHIVAGVIHEMLHTLGLGENPPSPKAITERVLAACKP